MQVVSNNEAKDDAVNFDAELKEVQRLMDCRKPEEALEHCYRAILLGERSNKDVSLIYQCIVDLHKDLVEEAIDSAEQHQQRHNAICAYRKLLATTTDTRIRALAFRGIGEIQRDLKLYLEAADVFKHMISLANYDRITKRDGLELLGDVLLRSAYVQTNALLCDNKVEEALSVFEQTLNLCDADDENDVISRLHVHIANCFYVLRKYEVAIFFYKKAFLQGCGFDVASKHTKSYARYVYFSLGSCYSALGDFVEAHMAYSTALEMSFAASDNACVTKCFLSLAKLRSSFNDDAVNVREVILKSLQYCPKMGLLEYKARMMLGDVEHKLYYFASAAFQFAKCRRIAKECGDLALSVDAAEKLRQVCTAEFFPKENDQFTLLPRDECAEAICLSASLRSLCDAVPLDAASTFTSISDFTTNTHSEFEKENEEEPQKENQDSNFLEILNSLAGNRMEEQRAMLGSIRTDAEFAKPKLPSASKSLRSMISFSRRRDHRASLASRDLNMSVATEQTETSAASSRPTSPGSTGSRRRSLFSFKRNNSNTKMLQF